MLAILGFYVTSRALIKNSIGGKNVHAVRVRGFEKQMTSVPPAKSENKEKATKMQGKWSESYMHLYAKRTICLNVFQCI